MFYSQKLSRDEWIARCAREIEMLLPQHAATEVEALSQGFLRDWAAAIWVMSQGAEQPELAAWAAVREARGIWNRATTQESGADTIQGKLPPTWLAKSRAASSLSSESDGTSSSPSTGLLSEKTGTRAPSERSTEHRS